MVSTYPSEKYDIVSWDDDYSQYMERYGKSKNSMVPKPPTSPMFDLEGLHIPGIPSPSSASKALQGQPPEGDLRAGEAQGLKLGHQQGIRALEAGSSSKSWTLPWKNEGFTEFDMKKWWFCWVLAILPWKNEGFTKFEMKKMMVLLSPSNSTMKKWGFYWVWNEKWWFCWVLAILPWKN